MSSSRRTERVLRDQILLRAVGLLLAIIGIWLFWTLTTDADWFNQALFLFAFVAIVVLSSRPQWFLNFLVAFIVADVTGFLTEAIQIPGLGLAALAGHAKLPELISVFMVLHLIVYFCLRPRDFRQPLIKQVFVFVAMGSVGVYVGLHNHYITTTVLRDSLASYISVFYIITLVLLPTLAAARTTFRILYYVLALGTLVLYGVVIVTGNTFWFYSAARAFLASACTYFLIAKLFTSPPRMRRWLTVAAIPFFSLGIFVGRTRGGVIAFLVGLLVLLYFLRPRDKFKVAAGVLIPCFAVMLLLFAVESRRGTFQMGRSTVGGGNNYFQMWTEASNPSERGIEAFTEMGSESDPTGKYRLELWRMGWNAFLESPVVGKGYGWMIPIVGKTGFYDAAASNLHNSYIHVLACGGLVGFIPLMAVVVGYYVFCRRRLRRCQTTNQRIWVGFAMAAATNFFLFASTNVGMEIFACAVPGWVILALAMKAIHAKPDEFQQIIPYRPSAG